MNKQKSGNSQCVGTFLLNITSKPLSGPDWRDFQHAQARGFFDDRIVAPESAFDRAQSPFQVGAEALKIGWNKRRY
jgi:hypothetical protein